MAQRSVMITLATGLHARPAAELARVARECDGRMRIRAGDRTVDAASVLAVMDLALGAGDRVLLEAEGADAEAALEAAEQLLAPG